MKIVAVASPKGGVGKSSLTALLSVIAVGTGARVAIIDLNNDQANLSQWWILRGEPQQPYLVRELSDLVSDVEVLAKSKFEWVFIDTPPLNVDLIETAVMVADAVIIPGRPSVFDLAAVEPLVEMCRARRKPHAILLSDVDLKFKTLNASALLAYAELAPVFETKISHRSAYANALTNGQVGPEIDKSLDAEVKGMWKELLQLLAKPYAKVAAPKQMMGAKHV